MDVKLLVFYNKNDIAKLPWLGEIRWTNWTVIWCSHCTAITSQSESLRNQKRRETGLGENGDTKIAIRAWLNDSLLSWQWAQKWVAQIPTTEECVARVLLSLLFFEGFQWNNDRHNFLMPVFDSEKTCHHELIRTSTATISNKVQERTTSPRLREIRRIHLP